MTTKAKTRKARFNIKPISKARFDKMTPAQKRVAIAKDILARVEAKQIIEKHGTYIGIKSADIRRKIDKSQSFNATQKDWDFVKSSAQELIQSEPCEACAKGAIALSMIANFNSASVSDAVRFSGETDDLPELSLEDIFPESMWSAIELAFDQEAIGMALHKPWSLKGVMKWLIKHKGNFPYNGYIYSDVEPADVGYELAPDKEPKGLK